METKVLNSRAIFLLVPETEEKGLAQLTRRFYGTFQIEGQHSLSSLIPSCNSWSKKDIRGSIELLVSRSTGWGESQKRLPTCRLRGLMSGSSSVQRPGVSGAGR